MSDYLIRELGATTNVTVRTDTEVAGADGAGRLEALVLRDRRTGGTDTVPAAALFVMIGAVPLTDWLPASIARDAAGYVLTGTDVTGGPAGRVPLFLESSVPGVFAVGDVAPRCHPSGGALGRQRRDRHQPRARVPRPSRLSSSTRTGAAPGCTRSRARASVPAVRPGSP